MTNYIFYCLPFIIICIMMLLQSYQKYSIQVDMYNQALTLSQLIGKPLLVIGDPTESATNYMFGAYGCGDICIDSAGCNCKDSVIIIKDKLEDSLHKFEDNSVVIFESETLEYVDDDKIDYVINEMNRISGKNIFSVHQLKPNTYLTTFKTNGYTIFNKFMNKPTYYHKRLFSTCPPNDDYIYD